MTDPANDLGFWQWVALGAIGLVSAISSLFTGTQLNRLGKIELKSDNCMPRDEFNETVRHFDDKLEAVRIQLGTEFAGLHQRIDRIVESRNHEHGNSR